MITLNIRKDNTLSCFRSNDKNISCSDSHQGFYYCKERNVYLIYFFGVHLKTCRVPLKVLHPNFYYIKSEFQMSFLAPFFFVILPVLIFYPFSGEIVPGIVRGKSHIKSQEK